MKNYYSTKTMSRLFCICVLKTHWDFTEKKLFPSFFLNFWLGGFSFLYKRYASISKKIVFERENLPYYKIFEFFWKKKIPKTFFFVKFQKLSTTNTTTKWDMSQCRAQFSENETKTIRTPPLNCLYYYIHSPFIRIFTLELYLKKHLFFMIARKKN